MLTVRRTSDEIEQCHKPWVKIKMNTGFHSTSPPIDLKETLDKECMPNYFFFGILPYRLLIRALQMERILHLLQLSLLLLL